MGCISLALNSEKSSAPGYSLERKRGIKRVKVYKSHECFSAPPTKDDVWRT
jgi:hypothetical protein